MFPQLKNKRFTDLSQGDVVTVQDQFENIAVLDNGQRINVNRLLDPVYFDEYIDPKSFLGDTYNVFAEKIKSIDLSQIKEDTTINDSAIIEVDPEQERREMEQKALLMAKQMNPGAAAQKQVDMLKEILGDDEDLPVVQSARVEVNNQPQVQSRQQVIQPKVEDPIITMFRNVKRNKDFSFTLTINEMIPRLDFIEMMEDSYQTSIIEFLADEFTQKLLSDPDFIKNKISEEIRSMVCKKDSSKKLEVITDKTSQPLEIINDGASNLKEEKPKTPRKPKTKPKTEQ